MPIGIEIAAATLTRGRMGAWLVESYEPDADGFERTTYNAAASLQEARALAKLVAWEKGWVGQGRWRADNGIHRFNFPA